MSFLILVREAILRRLDEAGTSWATVWRRSLPVLMFSVALLLYARSLVPDVLPGDVAEFQYVPAHLGLPHTNGFPFYVLLGWFWSHVPVGTLAWRMNLLSALGGALAVAMTTAFAQRLSGRSTVALTAGGLLALTPSFWFYSLAAERYTLTLGLLIGALWMAWERKIFLSSLFLVLGLATHFSAALLVFFWLPYILGRVSTLRRSLSPWLGIALPGILLVLLYLYVPWRWSAFANWPLLPGIGRSTAIYQGLFHGWYEPALHADTVWHYIAGEAGLMAGDAGLGAVLRGGWQEALTRSVDLLPVWRTEIPWPLALLVPLGFVRLLRRDSALALTLGIFAVITTLMAGFVQQAKPAAYLLPAFWVVLLVSSFALDSALSGAARARGFLRWVACMGDDRVMVTVVSVVLVAMMWHRYPDLDLHRRWESRIWWELNLAHPLEEGSGLLAHWGDLTPLWYVQHAEHRRRDLWGLFPPDLEEVVEPWLATGAPLYLAGPLHGWAADLPRHYTLAPWGNLVRILPPGGEVLCPPLSRALATPRSWPVSIVTWDVDQPLVGGTLSTLRLCWRARADLPLDTFLALQLRRAPDAPPVSVESPLVANWYPQDPIPQGTKGLAVVPVQLPLGIPGGSYATTLTVYRLDPEGGWKPWPGVTPIYLGQLRIAAGRDFTRAALTDEIVPPVPLQAGPLTLLAWRLSHIPVRPGDPVQIDMLWQVQERPTTGVTVQARFWEPGGRAVLTPAQPLVPGLPLDDWQPGTLLRSTHTLRAPRGLGDRTYLLEPRLLLDKELVPWWPIGRVVLGTVQVKDRPHSYTTPGGTTLADAFFGDVARLAGYTLSPLVCHSGETLVLTLYWQARVNVDTSYSVFVHLVDAQGQLVAQHDSPPANGALPTGIWLSGEIITDPHTVPLPADLPVGIYTLRVGMYNPYTAERVSVAPADSPDGALDLATIRVTP